MTVFFAFSFPLAYGFNSRRSKSRRRAEETGKGEGWGSDARGESDAGAKMDRVGEEDGGLWIKEVSGSVHVSDCRIEL